MARVGCAQFGAFISQWSNLVWQLLSLCFVVSWNDFLFPSILLSSPKNQTIPVGIAGWTSSYSINWGQVSAASILTIIPVIILYAFVGRYFVSGLTAGAVKS